MREEKLYNEASPEITPCKSKIKYKQKEPDCD
jgi:hypothetical protein